MGRFGARLGSRPWGDLGEGIISGPTCDAAPARCMHAARGESCRLRTPGVRHWTSGSLLPSTPDRWIRGRARGPGAWVTAISPPRCRGAPAAAPFV